MKENSLFLYFLCPFLYRSSNQFSLVFAYSLRRIHLLHSSILFFPRKTLRKKKKRKKKGSKRVLASNQRPGTIFFVGARGLINASTVLAVEAETFFSSLSLPLYRLTDAFRRRRVYRRKSDYERYITKIQKRLRVVCFISFAAGKPEMSLADSTRSLIVNFFWPWMIKAERRGGRT